MAGFAVVGSGVCCNSRPGNGSPSDSLLNTLDTLQTLDASLPEHIHVELLYHLYDHPKRLEEAVYRDAQHSVCCCFVVHSQHCLCLMVNTSRASVRCGDETEGARDKLRKLLVDGEGADGCFRETVGWEGDMYCPTLGSTYKELYSPVLRDAYKVQGKSALVVAELIVACYSVGGGCEKAVDM